MKTENLRQGKSGRDRAGPVKKEYRKPVLETYGLVKNLTQGTGSANGDGGQNMMTRMM